MDKKQIERINELARKKKTEGLTEEEAAERAELHTQSITEWREQTRAMLDNVVIQRPDGSREPLKKKAPTVKH